MIIYALPQWILPLIGVYPGSYHELSIKRVDSVGHSLISWYAVIIYALPRRILPFIGWCGNRSPTKHCLPLGWTV